MSRRGTRTSDQNQGPALPGEKFFATIICLICTIASPQSQIEIPMTEASRKP